MGFVSLPGEDGGYQIPEPKPIRVTSMDSLDRGSIRLSYTAAQIGYCLAIDQPRFALELRVGPGRLQGHYVPLPRDARSQPGLAPGQRFGQNDAAQPITLAVERIPELI